MGLGIKTEDLIAKLNEDEAQLAEETKPSVIKDLAAAPFRGIEGAIQSTYNFADWAVGDILPDYDNRLLGRSETIGGSLIEGVTQFLVPYAGIAKGVKAASAIGKFGKHFSRINKEGKQVLNWKGVLASESAADFIAFDAQEERLANLINEFPELKNPVSEFLAADENDGEIEGRLKNTLEGMGLTGAAGAMVVGIKALRANRLGKDGASVIRDSGSVFNSMGVIQRQYDSYSPVKKAVDGIVESKADSVKGIPYNKVADRILRANNERGVGEELKWLGLNDPEFVRGRFGDRVNPAELQEYVNQEQLNVVLLEAGRIDRMSYLHTYKQEGGRNHRAFELKVKAGTRGADDINLVNQETQKNLHDLTGNTAETLNSETLLHVRTTDHVGNNGERILFVEELQSDVIQGKNAALSSGEKQGYRKGRPLSDRERTNIEQTRLPLEESAMHSAIRMITQLAAREGYDKISFANADQVADLYKREIGHVKKVGNQYHLKQKSSRSEEEFVQIFNVDERKGRPILVDETGNLDLDPELSKAIMDGAGDGVYREVAEDGASRKAMHNTYTTTVNAQLNRFVKAFGSKANSFDEIHPSNTGFEPVEPYTYMDVKSSVFQEEDAVDLMFGKGEFRSYHYMDGAYIKQSKGDAEGVRVALGERLKKKLTEENVIDSRDMDDIIWDMNRIYDTEHGSLQDFDGFEIYQQIINDYNFNYKRELMGTVSDVIDEVSENLQFKPTTTGKRVRAASIEINDSMKASMDEGVSLWGLRDSNANPLRRLESERSSLKGNEFKIEENDTVASVLDRLDTQGSEQASKLARGLKELLGKSDIDNIPVLKNLGMVSLGRYEIKGRRSEQIDIRTGVGESEHTILHEVIHATAVTRMPQQISAARGLTGEAYMKSLDDYAAQADADQNVVALIDAFKKAHEAGPIDKRGLNTFNMFGPEGGSGVDINFYGLANLDEFITESLTNVKFQDYLKGIEGSGQNSLWDNILTVIKQFLGVDAKGTALEDVVSAYQGLVRKTKRQDPMLFTPEGFKQARFNALSGEETGSVINSALDQLEVTGIERGGSQAVRGLGKALANIETTDDMAALIGNMETKVATDLETTGSFTQQGLRKGGIVQAVENSRRFSEITGQRADIIETEIKAAGKDAQALRNIAARMYTVESMASAQADVVYSGAERIADMMKSGRLTDSKKAEFLGELSKMTHLIAAGSNLRRGFGQGLQSTQFGRTKLSLNAREIESQEIINQFLSNNGNRDFEKLINMIVMSGDPQDAISRMLGVAKVARVAEGGKFMQHAQNWFVNSLLSGPRTMMKNGVGNSITQALLQTELAVGGLTVDPTLTKMALKEFFTLDSMREATTFFLKAFNMKDQLLDLGRNPLENNAKNTQPRYFEQPTNGFQEGMNYFGENIVNLPTKILMSMDEVFKQSAFRQNAKLEFTLKGMKLGIKDPDELAEYVTRGVESVLIDGERAYSHANVIKHAQQVVKTKDDELFQTTGKRMRPEERARLTEQTVNEQVNRRHEAIKSREEGGLGVSQTELEDIGGRSLEFGRYSTFTNDAGKFAELAQALTQKVPVLGFIFPFIRTPTNILKFSFDRATFGVKSGGKSVLANLPDMPMLKETQMKLRDELNSRDPLTVARARGKIATSMMINTALFTSILHNRDIITGGGPKNNDQRRVLEGTGWRKYSFKVGDTYVGYSGLDPIGTHFGVLVDLVEQLDDVDQTISGTGEAVFSALTIAMTRNVTDKSYLAGLQFITDALSEPERKMDRLFRNLAGGFVPNYLYQGQSIVGDTTIRESRSMADVVFKKIPTLADNVDPKRNILGEAVIAENIPFVGPFNPSTIGTRKGDVVFEELAKLEHGFGVPSVKWNNIRLDQAVNESGQSAHDRKMELSGTIKIRGRTLRQELERLIGKRRYQRLSDLSAGGLKSPRVQEINSVISEYRAKAERQMLEEFPEVKQKYEDLLRAKKGARRGLDPNELLELLR